MSSRLVPNTERVLRRYRANSSHLALAIGCAALAGVVAWTPVEAASPNWVGGTSSDWYTGGNWQNSVFPTSLDFPTIDTTSPNPTVIGGGTAAYSNMWVGLNNSGLLTITNNAQVNGGQAALGQFVGSNGTVTVTGAGSIWNADGLDVGFGGTGTLNILNGAAVTSNPSPLTLGYQPSGNGTVTVDGAGSTLKVANMTVGRDGAGTLTVSNGGTVTATSFVNYIGENAGSVGTATITGPGSRLIVQNNGLIVGGAGNGTLTIADGAVVSTEGNLVLGAQAGSVGILNIGAGIGAAAVAPGTLDMGSQRVVFANGNGAINFDHTGSNYTFDSEISGLSGRGTINQIAGTTILTADSGTFTGATSVTGGRLAVNGSLAGSVVTVSGGILGGTGTVGNVIANSGGSFAPGDGTAGSSMTVTGNLTLASAAQYMVQVNPTTSSLANVTGTAKLGGATVAATYANGSYVSKQYTIVNAAGGVVGTFSAQVNTNLPANFATALSYDATHAYLNTTLSFAPSSGGFNQNQQNVANALTGFFSRTGGIPLAFGALTQAGLTQVSGETATGAQQTTFDAMTQFMGLMTDPFAAGRDVAQGGPTGYADESLNYAAKRNPNDALAAIYRKAPVMPFEARWNVWAAGFGGQRTTDGNAAAGSNNATSRIYGGAVGADYWFSPATVAGFALAGGGTNFSVANAGSGRSDLFQAGAFVRHTVGTAYITAAAAYGWQDVTTDRNVGGSALQGRFNANSYSGRIEGGNRYVLPWFGGVGVTPYAAVQVTAFDLPTYAETPVGSVNTFALSYTGKTVTATRSELGLRGDKSYAVGDALLTLGGRAAWAHDYNTDRNAQATFQTLPGASFVVNGASPARDAALTSASAEMKFASGISLAATFDGEFSDVTRSYAGKGVVRYQW